MKNLDCARCKQPAHRWLKVVCGCGEKCSHPACAGITVKCDCGRRECDGFKHLVVDPFMAEVHGERELRWLCGAAYQDRLDDI